MKHIVGISEIVLWTAEKEKALHFYHNLLGLEVISPPTLPNVFLKAGDGTTGIPQMILFPKRMPSKRSLRDTNSTTWHLNFPPTSSTPNTKRSLPLDTSRETASIPSWPVAPCISTIPMATRWSLSARLQACNEPFLIFCRSSFLSPIWLHLQCTLQNETFLLSSR